MPDPSNDSRKVVKGEVRKLERLGVFDLLFAGDVKTALKLAKSEVLKPRLMDMIVNYVDAFVRSFVYGDEYASHASIGGGNTNYRTISTSTNGQVKPADRYDVSTFEFNYYEDAKNVIAELQNTIKKFNKATVFDFYDFAGQQTVQTDYNYGWTSIGDVKPERTRTGWIIRLPKPIPIGR